MGFGCPLSVVARLHGGLDRLVLISAYELRGQELQDMWRKSSSVAVSTVSLSTIPREYVSPGYVALLAPADIWRGGTPGVRN